MKEQDTVRAILQLLHAHRIPAWRMNQGAMRGEHKGKRWFMKFGVTGMSDIIGIVQRTDGVHVGPVVGCFLAIEVKRAGNKPTPDQTAFLETIHQAGGVAILAYTIDDVAKRLGL